MTFQTSSNRSMWVKICGFTQPENARECAALLPDAIGLVFFEKSPRNVTVETAKQIIDVLPPSVIPIGVFVDKSLEDILFIALSCGLKGVQLHGREAPEIIPELQKKGLMVLKALFAERSPALDQADRYNKADGLLVEYGKGNLPGGNAEAWNYELARRMKTDRPVILAGGLAPSSVMDACMSAKPYGVDVSSMVEQSPGIKDVQKVKKFIDAVRSING